MTTAANIKVKKLARQLNVPVDTVLDALRELGHVRYASAEGMLPGELVPAVRANLQRPVVVPAPEPGPDPRAEVDLEAVMRSLGVRRLDTDRTRAAPAADGGEALRPRRAPAPAPSASLAVAPAGHPGRPWVESHLSDVQDALEASQAARRRLEAEVRRLELDCEQARAEVAGLAAKVAEATARASEAEARVERTQRLVDDLADQLRAYSQDFTPEAAGLTLAALLTERGLRGDDEHRAAVRALVDTRRWDRLAPQLTLAWPVKARRLLAEELLLVAEGSAELPPFVATVRVAAGRAELDAVEVVDRAVRRLSDVLLLNGHRRVLVAGVPGPMRKVLESGIDPRIELRLVPGDLRRPAAQVRLDLDGVRLVVLWEGRVIEEVAAAWEAAPATVLRVPARSLAGLLEAVCDALP